MEEISPNWIALIVAAISALVVGFVWYNPKVFGTIWMREAGITEEKAKKANMPKVFSWSVILAFMASFFIWSLVMYGGGAGEIHGTPKYMTFKHGAFHGAIAALFLVMPAMVTNALFEQKSFKYMAINVGYWIVTFSLMGGIVNAWN
ncbi:MAG: hypothetical protein BM564_03905 [Bacteroidetes bacterium MedPE-SWsnd-G2]|nr:MAG: hypothetical protein BM564_03905 [Bacteroidetes bacterium MedPE-SWsnd-G2]